MMDKCFNEIEISHFRGFDYIKIANLTKLNVLSGLIMWGKARYWKLYSCYPACLTL